MLYSTTMIDETNWIQDVKARGLGRTLSLLLDAIEPLGPLGAQMLWMAQPVSRLFGAADMLGELANALETPDGIDELRRRLHND